MGVPLEDMDAVFGEGELPQIFNVTGISLFLSR